MPTSTRRLWLRSSESHEACRPVQTLGCSVECLPRWVRSGTRPGQTGGASQPKRGATHVGFVRGRWTPRPIGFVRGMTIRPLERRFPHACVQNACWVRSGTFGPAAESASFGGAFAQVFTG
jgi:hypothetical protein